MESGQDSTPNSVMLKVESLMFFHVYFVLPY